MSHKSEIRPLRIEEAAEAKRIVFQIAHEVMEPETPFEEFRTLWDSWGIFNDMHDVQRNYFDNRGVFLVSVSDEQIVGTGAFLRYEVEGYCELKRITLMPEYRRQGLGYALLKELLQRARAMGYAKAILWTNRYKLARAVAFYRQISFVEVPHEGAEEDEIWMEISLVSTD
jgi:putative acetyltransferase